MARRRGIRSDLTTLIETATDQGWRVELTNGGHLKWLPPNGMNMYFSASTPSDWRAIANIRSHLKRRGLVV